MASHLGGKDGKGVHLRSRENGKRAPLREERDRHRITLGKGSRRFGRRRFFLMWKMKRGPSREGWEGKEAPLGVGQEEVSSLAARVGT